MKKLWILLAIVMILIIIIAVKNSKPELIKKPTIYTFNNPLDENFPNMYPFLLDIKEVSFWQTYYNGEKVMAKSTKNLDRDSFSLLIDDFIKSEYVTQGGWNQKMEVKERQITENENYILISDKGINAVFNDVPPFQTTYTVIILEYRYDKNSHDIYFKALIPGE